MQAESFAMMAALGILEDGGGDHYDQSFATTTKEESSDNTFTQRLAARVIANIEIKVRNLHVRYEDALTCTGKTISAGITLDEFLVVSTDENWIESILVVATAAATSIAANIANTLSGSGGGSSVKPQMGESKMPLPLHPLSLEQPPPTSSATVSTTTMYKLATLRNMAVYWDTRCIPFAVGMSSEMVGASAALRWEQCMSSMIYKDRPHHEKETEQQQQQQQQQHQYILTPPNCTTIKLIHNEGILKGVKDTHRENIGSTTLPSAPPTASTPLSAANVRLAAVLDEPRLDVFVAFPSLKLSLDRLQLHQICLVIDAFAAKKRQQLLFLFRPFCRPTQDPRGWWLYAYRLVTGRDDLVFHNVRACVLF